MKKELVPILSEAYEIFSNAKNRMVSRICSNPQQKKLLEEIVQEIMGTSLDMQVTNNTIPNIDLDDTLDKIPIWFDQLEKLIKKVIELAPQKEIVLQTPFMKILLLAWLFSFRDEMVMTFPHEELGRYPEIKDINSREIYRNNEQNLELLIKRVSGCCEKINDMMNI